MSDCRKCAKYEECAVDEDCGLFVEKPMTHGDEIRSLSDYDLADWIAQILTYHSAYVTRAIYEYECPHECPLYKCCNDQPSDNIEDWLKSPVEEVDE